MSVRRRIRPKPKKRTKPKNPDTGAYGARVDRLFQEAIRDLEALKQASGRKPAERTRPA